MKDLTYSAKERASEHLSLSVRNPVNFQHDIKWRAPPLPPSSSPGVEAKDLYSVELKTLQCPQPPTDLETIQP